MFTRRWCAALLILSLASSGCRTASSPDPLGLENPSMLSGLVPQRSGRTPSRAARRGAAASGDPFIESVPVADREPAGRAVLSDSFAGDHAVGASRDAAYLTAQPEAEAIPEVLPVAGTARQADALVQSAMFETNSVPPSTDKAALQQRLQDLEWELQFTDDHAAQEQLALEIARLRKQLSRSRR